MKNANIFETYRGFKYGIDEGRRVFFVMEKSKTVEIPLNELTEISTWGTCTCTGLDISYTRDDKKFSYTITSTDVEDAKSRSDNERADKELDKFLDMYGNDPRLPWKK